MSEKVVPLEERARGVFAELGHFGITHVSGSHYKSNGRTVHQVRADGDLGEGPVVVTAIQEGDVDTFMMEGPANSDDGRKGGDFHGADSVKGPYQRVAHDLLTLIAAHVDEIDVDLPLDETQALIIPTQFID